jgi:hypothetical protein
VIGVVEQPNSAKVAVKLLPSLVSIGLAVLYGTDMDVEAERIHSLLQHYSHEGLMVY